MTTEKPFRTDVLRVPVDCITMEGAVSFAEHLIDGGAKGQYILAINPEKVMVLLREEAMPELVTRKTGTAPHFPAGKKGAVPHFLWAKRPGGLPNALSEDDARLNIGKF